MEPSHPDAEATPSLALDIELVPDRPPIDNIRFPAIPPERYDRSFLYSGDIATVFTGRPKLRNMTSLGSISEATQTLPSIEDDAM